MRRQQLIFAILVGMVSAGSASETSANPHTWIPGGVLGEPYWGHTANWSTGNIPNASDAVVIFDASVDPNYEVNTHPSPVPPNDYKINEMRFESSSQWWFHNAHRDLNFTSPAAGGTALLTQNGSGSIELEFDPIMTADLVVGGTGSGGITALGSQTYYHSSYGPRFGMHGPGGLTKNGSFDLVIENVASYEGPTAINAGRLLFNAESAEPNPAADPAEPSTYYLPVTMGAVSVNHGGTLGGTGTLRSPVTVHDGGTLAPGVSPGVFTVDSLTLNSGSTTEIELGGIAPGNTSSDHDQVVVTGQASLGGTLNLSTTGGYTPTKGTNYRILQYGSLDPTAAAFDSVSVPTGMPAHYGLELYYGSGTNDAVNASIAATYYYTGNDATHDYWEQAANWDPVEEPGYDPNAGDIVVFDKSRLLKPRTRTNIYNNDRYVREIRFVSDSSWELYHNHLSLHLNNPVPGETARFVQEDAGAVTLNCDVSLDDDTVFSGVGSGSVTVFGRLVEQATHGLRQGLYGPAGLIKQGDYTLVLKNYASYEGTTQIDQGTLQFDADSKAPNPDFSAGDTSTWYWVDATLGPVHVNDGGTLSGNGTLRAPVTVHDGGTLAPGVSPGVFTIDHDVTMEAGSELLVEIGGASPGTGAGFHDQLVVGGQLSLGGTLQPVSYGGHIVRDGDSFALVHYDSLNPGAGQFDSVAGLADRPNVLFDVDYGSGTADQIVATAQVMPHHWVGGGTDPHWAVAQNWSYDVEPGENPEYGDVVIFNLDDQSAYSINTHEGPYTVAEMRVESSSDYTFHNPHRDIHLYQPEAGQPARFTQNGAGSITLNYDPKLESDTVFGGTGTGAVTVNGSSTTVHPGDGPRHGLYGPGGLTKQGDFDLIVNNVASWQGPTEIDGGALLFNADSAVQNPVYGDPGEPDYLPETMGPVSVNDGGTLGGTGRLWAEVTVGAGGTLEPGMSPGVLTLGELELLAGSESIFELGGLTPGEGSGHHDQVIVTDGEGLGLSGMLSLGGTLTVQTVDGFEPGPRDSFVLFEYDELDPAANVFDALDFPAFDWGTWSINYGTGTNSQVTLNAVPEPASVGLLLIGLAGGLLVGRRGRKIG